MKKSRKTILSCFASVTALLILASGCSTGKNTSSANTSKAEQLVCVIPVSGTVQQDMPLVQDKISSITKKLINATVKITNISYANWTQQTNLMLASGEQADIMWASSNYGYSTIVANGQLQPLNDLLTKYGKGITQSLGGDYINAAKVNGKVYALPSMRDFAAVYGVTMNKSIADKYNIDPSKITKASDFTAVLQTIKQNEPNIYPLASPPNATTAESIYMGTFDPLGDKFGGLRYSDNNLKVIDIFETPEYASYLDLIRSWYMAGYLPKDAATTQDAPRDLIKAGKAFSYNANFKPGFVGQEQRITGIQEETADWTGTITNTSFVTNQMEGIPTAAKDPARSMMLLNLWYTNADIVNAYDCGIEGRNYVKVGDNSVTFPSGIAATNTTYSPTNYWIGNNFLSYIWSGDPNDLWSQMKSFNSGATKSKAFGFSFDETPVKTQVAAVTTVYTQYRRGLESGTLDPRTALPDFISKMKSAGLDQIISEKQKQLDAWAKANNVK